MKKSGLRKMKLKPKESRKILALLSESGKQNSDYDVIEEASIGEDKQ